MDEDKNSPTLNLVNTESNLPAVNTDSNPENVDFRFVVSETFGRCDIVKLVISTDIVEEVNYPNNNKVLVTVSKLNDEEFIRKINLINVNAIKFRWLKRSIKKS